MRARMPHLHGLARDVRFCLVFPRESLSIPVMRHVLGDTLSRFGMDEECISDLVFAVTEACTNVVRHAALATRDTSLSPRSAGAGAWFRSPTQAAASAGPGSGRRAASTCAGRREARCRCSCAAGRASPTSPGSPNPAAAWPSMRACVDDVSLHSGPGKGTVVQLGKRIEWRDDAPLADLGGWALRDAG